LGNITAGHLYLRAWLAIPDTFSISEPSAAASLLVLGDSRSPFPGVSLVLWQTGFSLQINPPGPQAGKFDTQIPPNECFCLRIDFPVASNAMTSEFRLRIGEQQIANSESDALVNSAVSFDRVWMGINYITDNQTQPVTVHYDDLVVDTQDIACE
jgi:hypothetical protein